MSSLVIQEVGIWFTGVPVHHFNYSCSLRGSIVIIAASIDFLDPPFFLLLLFHSSAQPFKKTCNKILTKLRSAKKKSTAASLKLHVECDPPISPSCQPQSPNLVWSAFWNCIIYNWFASRWCGNRQCIIVVIIQNPWLPSSFSSPFVPSSIINLSDLASETALFVINCF